MKVAAPLAGFTMPFPPLSLPGGTLPDPTGCGPPCQAGSAWRVLGEGLCSPRRTLCRDQVFPHRFRLQTLPAAASQVRHPLHHLEEPAHRPAAQGALQRRRRVPQGERPAGPEPAVLHSCVVAGAMSFPLPGPLNRQLRSLSRSRPCCVEGGTYRARRPPGPGPAVVMATESLGPWEEGALAVTALGGWQVALSPALRLGQQGRPHLMGPPWSLFHSQWRATWASTLCPQPA